MSHKNPRTTDKYFKVKKQSDKAPENEVRIRAESRIGKYISYAAQLLKGENKKDFIILKASGNATKSACQIAEILRHKILGLHQLNILKTIPVIDEYEPKEEGLDKVTVERKLAVLEIHLSLKDGQFKTSEPGYQAPLPKEQVNEEDLTQKPPRRGDGEGRDDRDGEGRPRRGRGGRGRYTGTRGGARRGGDRRDDNRGGDRRDDTRGGDRRDDRDRRDYRDNRDNRDNRRFNDDRRGDGGERRGYGGGRPRTEGGRRDDDRNGGRPRTEGGRRDEYRDNRDNRDHRDNRDNRDNRDKKY